MQKRTLYDIEQDFLALEEILEQTGGDISDAEIESQIDYFLDNLNLELAQKLDGYARLMREIEIRAEARRVESRRLAELAKADSNKVEKMKERLKAFFERRNLDKIETNHFKFSIAKNGGKQPLWLSEFATTAPEQLDERFHTFFFEINKDAIREALEAGEELDFARLEERGTSLRIK